MGDCMLSAAGVGLMELIVMLNVTNLRKTLGIPCLHCQVMVIIRVSVHLEISYLLWGDLFLLLLAVTWFKCWIKSKVLGGGCVICQAPVVIDINGQLYVIGGYSNDHFLDSVEIYNPISNTWSMLPEKMKRGFSFEQAALIDKSTIKL